MNINDPAVYISILSSSLLIISEILPFLPCKPNGLCDIFLNISPCCKKYTPDRQKERKYIEKEIELEREKCEHNKKNDIQLERMLYNILNDFDDLEEHKLSIKDIKSSIKKIIIHLKNDDDV